MPVTVHPPCACQASIYAVLAGITSLTHRNAAAAQSGKLA